MGLTTPSRPVPDERPRQRAKRRKGLNALSDLDAWDYTDKEILDAARESWRSAAYAHYNVKVVRYYDGLGNNWRLAISFECKYQHPNHNLLERDRLRTSDGTSNLLKTAIACDRRRGAVQLATGGANQPQPWTAARHYAMLAIRCARNHRPFASVVDPLHVEEVQMLRPGTLLPTAASISNYVRYIYEGASHDAALYLQDLPGALHLAVDGWTSPTSTSFLGIVVFWEEDRVMWRAVLEFVRLTKSHTGDYLAEQIEDCLERYGVKHKVLTLCADNASNNNTLVRRLSIRLPNFRGPQDRVRCIAHIFNLMCKAFTSLFLPASGQSNAVTSADDEELNTEIDDPQGDVDPDKFQHDQGVVQGVTREALSMMAASGLHVSSAELTCARKLIPKVAGLVRRINDSPHLENLFLELVDKDPDLQGDMRALARYGPIHYLTTNARYKLGRWALDPEQSKLMDQLELVLEIFKEPTDRMSQSGVPLVSKVVPELLTARDRLYDVRDDTFQRDLHPVVRVAAEASLLVFEKYMGLTLEESDVHIIAIVMCPDRKLKWYTDRGYEVDSIRSRVVSRFKELYPDASNETRAQSNPQPVRNIFLQRHSSSSLAPASLNDDTIQAYLDSPVLPHDVLTQHGGVIPYWNNELSRRPRLARMALDYRTAPASSVDAERAFSSGRLTVNHLQHQMSTRTFQAQMAIGSWFGTPLLPDITRAAAILETRMHKKCDQRQPICKRCEAGNFECLGYDHNERARVSSTQSTTDNLHLVPIRPKASKDVGTPSRATECENRNSEKRPLSREWPEHTSIPSFCELDFSTNLNRNTFGVTPIANNKNTTFSDRPQIHGVEDFVYTLAAQSTFKSTDDAMSILRKIVHLQTQLPYSPLDPLKTFLRSQWFIDYIMSESSRITDYWYFKPTDLKTNHFRRRLAQRLQISDFTRWITLVGIGIIRSFLTGNLSQGSQHNFWLEYINGSLKHELTRDLVPQEMQERRNEWVHTSLLRATVLHSSYIYQWIRSIAPTFLQAVFSDPTLWPSDCNVTRVPLSSILSLEAYQLASFALMDSTCAMAFGLPQQVEYDTTIHQKVCGASSHQWSHSTPTNFQLLLADINACRDKSPAARDWRDIEQSLLTWESRPGEYTFKESWKAIAWYAVQESWRLALLVYLYLAVCGARSDEPRIQSHIKQILQVIGTIKKQESSGSNVSFFIQYLIVGICARREAHRQEVRDKLSAPNETKLWLLRASDFVPVLDKLWHGAAADGRPVGWTDYMRSREAMLPVVL